MAFKNHVNAIVVGAGAGGGVVAKELAEAGLSVILFERGGWPDMQFTSDEIHSQRIPSFGAPFGPDDERYRRVVEDPTGKTQIVRPSEGGYNNNAACVGSGTAVYGAQGWRFRPEDFKMRTTYGDVEGATLEDWPISYEELEPFYEKVEWEIGVSGDDSQSPFTAPRQKPQPMPPFSFNKEAKILDPAAKRLGWHPFPVPMLRNSEPYNGRGACIRRQICVGVACPANAKNGTQNTVIPTAMDTGNCELRTNTIVSGLMLDDKGRAKGVRYYDADEKPHEQTADLVVLSCSATETARLLLNTKTKLFPNGAGNRYDWVGRNLQGHAYTGAIGLFEEDVYDEKGPGVNIAICDFNHGNEGHVGGGMLATEYYRLPYTFTGVRPEGEPTWGKSHKDFQRMNYKRNIAVHGPVQELPVFEARVTIDPKVKDHWGIPTLRLSGSRHPQDLETAEFLSSQADKWLKEAGAVQTWRKLPGLWLSGGQHQAGTCRMGNDPKTSVTNRYGQVHEIDNLFVADGSLHVTNGGFNPSLTIMALGYWVADYIKKEWKGTKFQS